MSKDKNTSLSNTFWMEEYLDNFLNSLTRKGYAQRTINLYRCYSARLCAHARVLGISQEDLDAELFCNLACTCPGTGTNHMEYTLFRIARRITEHLIDDGLIIPPAVIPEIEGSPEQLIREFDHWLSHNQGLSETTKTIYRRAFQLFLNYICTTFGSVGALSSLTPGTLYAFLDDHSGKNGWRVSFLQNILRFLFWRGRTSRDLSSALPPVAARHHKNVSRHVDPETVGKLLAVIRGDTPLALRDYTALLLMARLGLRAEEVVAMRLGDIDWAIGRVLIRGKGGGGRSKLHAPSNRCWRCPGGVAALWPAGISKAGFCFRFSACPPFGIITPDPQGHP